MNSLHHILLLVLVCCCATTWLLSPVLAQPLCNPPDCADSDPARVDTLNSCDFGWRVSCVFNTNTQHCNWQASCFIPSRAPGGSTLNPGDYEECECGEAPLITLPDKSTTTADFCSWNKEAQKCEWIRYEPVTNPCTDCGEPPKMTPCWNGKQPQMKCARASEWKTCRWQSQCDPVPSPPPIDGTKTLPPASKLVPVWQRCPEQFCGSKPNMPALTCESGVPAPLPVCARTAQISTASDARLLLDVTDRDGASETSSVLYSACAWHVPACDPCADSECGATPAGLKCSPMSNQMPPRCVRDSGFTFRGNDEPWVAAVKPGGKSVSSSGVSVVVPSPLPSTRGSCVWMASKCKTPPPDPTPTPTPGPTPAPKPLVCAMSDCGTETPAYMYYCPPPKVGPSLSCERPTPGEACQWHVEPCHMPQDDVIVLCPASQCDDVPVPTIITPPPPPKTCTCPDGLAWCSKCLEETRPDGTTDEDWLHDPSHGGGGGRATSSSTTQMKCLGGDPTANCAAPAPAKDTSTQSNCIGGDPTANCGGGGSSVQYICASSQTGTACSWRLASEARSILDPQQNYRVLAGGGGVPSNGATIVRGSDSDCSAADACGVQPPLVPCPGGAGRSVKCVWQSTIGRCGFAISSCPAAKALFPGGEATQGSAQSGGLSPAALAALLALCALALVGAAAGFMYVRRAKHAAQLKSHMDALAQRGDSTSKEGGLEMSRRMHSSTSAVSSASRVMNINQPHRSTVSPPSRVSCTRPSLAASPKPARATAAAL